MSTGRPSCYILIDTNLLAERTRLLRTGLGPVLLHFAKIRVAKIVIPEVVRSESTRYVIRAVDALTEKLVSGLRQVREFVGQSPSPTLPSTRDVEKAVASRFTELEPWTFAVDNRPELLLRSADRVLRKIAPSHQRSRDSYKDALIWECLMELPQGCVLHFASMDSGFFDPEGGDELHPTLSAEAADRKFTVTAHRGLGSLVRALQGTEPEIDRSRAGAVICQAIAPHMIRAMQRWQIQETGQEIVKLEAFVTERAGELYIEFTVDCPVVGTAVFNGVRFDGAKMRFQGGGNYDPHGTLTHVRISLEALYAADGKELDVTMTERAEMQIQIGEPRERFKLREPLLGLLEEGGQQLRGRKRGQGRRRDSK